MITVSTRQENHGDHTAVADIHRQAFGRELEGEIAANLRIGGEFIPDLSLVAESDGKVVGHIILSRLRYDVATSECRLLALGPIGVLPNFQKQGVGTSLMNEAIRRSRELGFLGIALIGHPTYYPRFGFQPASRFGIVLPYKVPDDVAMVLALFEESLTGCEGSVLFPPAFVD
jgi:putative acetyltransferase